MSGEIALNSTQTSGVLSHQNETMYLEYA